MITRRFSCNVETFQRSGVRLKPAFKGALFAMALSCNAISAQAAALPGAGDNWTLTGGTLEGTRFSTLADITPNNVAKLKEEFSFQTGVRGSHMGEPLVVGSTLYAVTPYPDKLIAYDLTTGKTKWTYKPRISEYARGVNCCDKTNRGAAYADGKIIYNLLDNTTVAVNATTGKRVWATKLADEHTGVTMTGAPIIAKDKVIVGTSSGEMGVRGWVQALDVKTGKKLWRGYSTGPDTDVLFTSNSKPFYKKDQGKNLGQTTWPGKAWQQGGSSAWAYLTYDPKMNLVFYGTSQPGVWNPELRPGDNKWGSSIFARNADTGEVVWAYQFTPNDGWDYDAVSENISVTQIVDGKLRDLLVHFDKNGFAYTFDRETGQILHAPPFVEEVNWATGVNTATGLPDIDPNKKTHTGKDSDRICPSVLGGKGWEPGAFSPATGLFYMPTFNYCSVHHMLKAEFVSGAPYMGQDSSIVPGSDKSYTSELIAWNAAQGKMKWAVKEPRAIYGGVLATAGGVVFYGTQDKAFKAVDAATGKLLFNTTLECSTVGNPISFKGPNGKQRIAVFSGVGDLAGAIGGGGVCPGKSGTGGRVHVYKLS